MKVTDWLDPNMSTRDPYNIQEVYTNHKETKGMSEQLMDWSAIEDIIEYLRAITTWLEGDPRIEPPDPRQFQKRLLL